MLKLYKYIVISVVILLAACCKVKASDFSDNTFLIANVSTQNYNSNRLWDFLKTNDFSGIDIKLDTLGKEVFMNGSNRSFASILNKLGSLVVENESKFVPIFLNFNGDVLVLDSIINNSEISSQIFYLPQGEAWPTFEYLVQANRRFARHSQIDIVNHLAAAHFNGQELAFSICQS